ncbi:MAG: phosphotransferase, partial [Acidimicrobiales bacterium]
MAATSPERPTRMHADEVDVNDDLIRGLISTQFPQWAGLALRRMPSTGTDNAIYRLGRHLGVRVPRVQWAVQQVAKEAAWLPHLAPHLPAAVPEPVAQGEPADGYPFPWLVYRWLHGQDTLVGPVDDWCQLARDIAAFVSGLQKVNPSGAPEARGRAGSLAPHDAVTRSAITRLDGLIDVGRAMAMWEAAVSADPWPRSPVWVHGDLLPGNVVVRDGRLAGIIDSSAAAIGDPACEAMLAWAMPPDARAVYRTALTIVDATWARGRGWALQQAVLFIPYYAETIPDGVTAARRRLDALLNEHDPSPVRLASSRTTVHRLGDVVVRSAGPWAPSVHALLRHLEAADFPGSPRVIGSGFDADGNEVLSYIDGEFVHPHAWTDEGMTALGVLLRRFHDATATLVAPTHAVWQPWFTRSARPDAIIGHGDLGPWNIVARAGLPVGIIDWEFAGPVDRLDEIAQAAWLNAQLHDDDVAARNTLPSPEARA